MPNVSQAQRGAMAAAAAGKSTLGIPKSVGQEFMAADKGGKLPARKGKKMALGGYVKGDGGRTQEDRPRGGPPITERSRFMKQPDVFRTSIEEQDYPKGSKAHARPKGKGKVEEVED